MFADLRVAGPMLLAGAALGACEPEASTDSASGVAVEAPPPRSVTVNVYVPRSDECDVHPFSRIVAGTRPLDFVWGALESLLEGATEEEAAAGYESAIPSPIQVGRHWQSYEAWDQPAPHDGQSVRIQEIREEEPRLLYVSFTGELEAFETGMKRICPIVAQIEATVTQFDAYDNVRIAVDGKSRGTLQP